MAIDINDDVMTFYPVENYAIIDRENQPEEDTSVPARLTRLEAQYKETGIRRSVDGILVVISHGLPHILVMQVANSFYKLPGGYLDPTESDVEGLLLRLNEQLGVPAIDNPEIGPNKFDVPSLNWEVKACTSVWWRPNFDTFLYPYLPPHIVEPKEIKKLYMVQLPMTKTLAVPANMKLHSVPIFEFYDNAARCGPQFAGLPYILSKYMLPAHKEAEAASRSPGAV